MTQIELTRKALEILKEGISFNCVLRAYEGGACGDGWDGEDKIELSEGELLYLISQQNVDKEIFEGLKLTPINIESMLSDMAESGACVDEFYEFSDYDEDEIEELKDCWSYSGECSQLEGFLKSWEIVLNKIMAGEITEDNLDECLEYFDDSSNFDFLIEI